MTSRAFGYKMAWVAARGASPDALADALGAVDARPCGWSDGVDGIYAVDASSSRPVFVTPDVDGWVLAASPAFFDEASEEEPGRLGTFATELSARLDTDVQLFLTHRVVEGHGWARADRGRLVRAFCYLGEIDEVVVDDGPVTPEEGALGVEALMAGDDRPDESTVVALADRWSLDPSGIEERHPDVENGYLATLPAPAGASHADVEPPPPRRPWWKLW